MSQRDSKTTSSDPQQDAKLYGKQTRLAIDNFKISNLRLQPAFIHTLGLIKLCAAKANAALGVLPAEVATAIVSAAEEVASGRHDDQFPIDLFQTGSGTSTNMNANEVIASLAERHLKRPVHPNDDVNRGQSSNDVIPTAIHVSAALELGSLSQALTELRDQLLERASQYQHLVKTGRTHLMDAVPITFGQELAGWAAQIENDQSRLQDVTQRLHQLAQGGTAVGTGLNAHPGFASKFAEELSQRTGLPFRPATNAFAAISAQDTVVELSGQLRVTAISLLKIATDLRWMNSGPVAGLMEITLPELQPGSSIMPGKVNPVIPEAVGMACVQVQGLDAAIAVAAQDNRFQLATMLPLLAYNLLMQLSLLTGAAHALSSQAIARLEVNEPALTRKVQQNAMLVTALTPRIGYDLAGRIARQALQEQRPILEVARELTDLDESDLKALLDPAGLAHPQDNE